MEINNNLVDNAQKHLVEGNYSSALNLLIKACEINPYDDIAQTNLSYLAYLTGNIPLAISAGRTAVSLNKERVEAYVNLGNALRSNGDIEEAIFCLETAITKNPQFAEAWTNLNLAYLDVGRITDAITAGQKTLSINNGLIHGYSNLAVALQQAGNTITADKILAIAIKLQPSIHFCHNNYLMNLQYLNQVSSETMRNAAAKFGELFVEEKKKSKRNSRKKSKLKIGYVSGDFRTHPVGFFLAPVIAEHNKDTIEVFLYANQNINDEITEKLKANSEHWENILHLNDVQVCEKIKSDQIDILVDLSGHTAGNRLGVFALRPAPYQVSWLGYFASTGLTSIDYVLLNEAQAPLGSESFFTERIYRLSNCQFCYQPPSYLPNLKKPPHLHNGYITFGSFNNIAKINTEVIAMWSTILRNVSNSKLLLKWKSFQDNQIKQEFFQRFSQYGIDKERIELRGYSPHQELLEQYNDIDIALDTFPFSGALTTCEALLMGVPVITMFQKRPVSRQTLSLLKSIQLEQLAANTPILYNKIAVELAQNTDKLCSLKTDIRQRMQHKQDAKKLTLNLEEAFWDIFLNRSKV